MKCIVNSKLTFSKLILLVLLAFSDSTSAQITTCSHQTLSATFKPNYRNRIDVLSKQPIPTSPSLQTVISSSFENRPQYKQHINTVFSTMRGWRNRNPMSIRKHLAIAVVITDSDGDIDNCNKEYTTLVAVKKDDGSINTQTYTANPNHLLFRYAYGIGFYIGEAITDFQFTINQDTPAANWGTELANEENNFSLTDAEVNAARGEFLLMDAYLQGKLRFFQIRVK